MTARIEPRTASAVTRMFFKHLDKADIQVQDLSEKCGIHKNTLYFWRSGKAAATVLNMEAVLSVLGLELVIRPIQSEPEELPR